MLLCAELRALFFAPIDGYGWMRFGEIPLAFFAGKKEREADSDGFAGTQRFEYLTRRHAGDSSFGNCFAAA
jgi:hypothetical protein